MNRIRLAHIWVVTAGLVLVAASGFGGYLVGGSTSWAAASSFDRGFEAARDSLCNLGVSDSGRPTVLDSRTVAGLAPHLVVADDSCTDERIRWWNEAQEAAGSPARGCRYDHELDIITAVIGAGDCIAPVTLRGEN